MSEIPPDSPELLAAARLLHQFVCGFEAKYRTDALTVVKAIRAVLQVAVDPNLGDKLGGQKLTGNPVGHRERLVQRLGEDVVVTLENYFQVKSNPLDVK